MAYMQRAAPGRTDLLLAVALIAISQVEVWRYDVAEGGLGAAATLGGACLLVAWRTRFPLAVAAGVIGAAFACAVLAGDPGSVGLAAAIIVAFYTVGTMRDRRRAVAGLVFGLVAGLPMTADGSINTYLAIVLTSFGVPWLVGTLRLRQRRTRELEAAAAAAAAEERARLARELHDVVSHNVGMIVVQAGAGDVLLDEQPARAREALRAIEAGARDALVELRRMLGLLREDGEPSLAPQATLARLDQLVDRVRSAGVPVEVDVEGEPRPLEAALDLTAYRIVQEGLTNILKHAGPCEARVTLRYENELLQVEVLDTGGGSEAVRDGYGLTGLGERVALLGGTLERGAAGRGGYLLRARIPLADMRQ